MDVFYFERRGAYGRYLRQYPTHSPYVNKGIYKAVNECRELFKYNRWNCHSQNPHQPFGDVVDKGTCFFIDAFELFCKPNKFLTFKTAATDKDNKTFNKSKSLCRKFWLIFECFAGCIQ